MIVTDTPAHDLDLERSLIASVLHRGDLFAECDGIVCAGDAFYNEGHRMLWGTIGPAIAEGLKLDARTLYAALKDQCEPFGGRGWLESVCCAEYHGFHAKTYAVKIRDLFDHRQVRLIQMQIGEWRSEGLEPSEITSRLRGRLDELDAGRRDEMAVTAAQGVQMAQKRYEQAGTGIATGFSSIDRNLGGGFYGGQMIVVAARPGVGKSSLAESFALNISKRGDVVGIAQLEQSTEEVTDRLLSRHSHVPLERIKTQTMDEKERSRFVNAQNVISACSYSITERTSLQQIRNFARSLPGLKVLIVDYLQLVVPTKKSNSREQEVAEVSRGLKLLAKELKISVVALAQLNREVVKRTNKVPVLADLRESGAIEQDADVVMFIDRPSMYDSQEDPTKGVLYIAKQRNGPAGKKVDLKWKPELASFFGLNPMEENAALYGDAIAGF